MFPPLNAEELTKYKHTLDAVKTEEVKNAKGKALEVLAAFLFEHSLCFRSFGSIVTATGQIDHFVEKCGITGLFLDEWSSSVIIECKNWSEKIGAEIIDPVGSKAKKSGSNVAMMFSRRGLTGNKGFDGLGEVRNWYSLHRVAILTLDEKDLESLAAGENFISLLRHKYFEVKMLA